MTSNESETKLTEGAASEAGESPEAVTSVNGACDALEENGPSPDLPVSAASEGGVDSARNPQTLETMVGVLLETDGFRNPVEAALANLKGLLTADRVASSLKRGLASLDSTGISREKVERAATPILNNLCERIGEDFIRARVATEVALAYPKGISPEIDLSGETLKALDRLTKADETFLDAMIKGLISTIAAGMEADSRGSDDARKLAGENRHLRNEVERLRAMANERAELIERLKKDYENLRKRSEEREEAIQRNASERIAADILPALDTFDRALVSCTGAGEALEPYLRGFSAIRGQFNDILLRNGVFMMECAGQPFDPDFHDAVFHKPESEIDEGTIVDVVEAGYLINEKVLRHAKVVVAKKMD